MTQRKLEFAAEMATAAWLAGGAVTAAHAQTGGGATLPAREIAAKSHEAYAALASYSDSGTVVSEMAGQSLRLVFNTRLQRPNLYRIDWTQGATGIILKSDKGVAWSDGSGDYFQSTATGQEKYANAQKMQNMKKALTQAAGPSWSAASAIPGAFFDQEVGDVFVASVASGRYPLEREKDAMVGGVDCYVVSNTTDFSKVPDIGKPGTASTTLWIGKADFLIHQSRTRYAEKVDSSDEAIDEAIRKALKMQNKPATPEAIAAMKPQMKAIMKQLQSGFAAGVVHTQTHENIVVNRKYSPADFALK